MRSPDSTSKMARLKRRADFVRAGKGRRWHGKSVSLQAARRDRTDGNEGCVGPARIGFTLTKKVGCAVVRNRARRRLKEALRLSAGLGVSPGYDYVFVGRLDAIRLPFDDLRNEMCQAIRGVHDEARSGSRHPGGTGSRKTRVKP